MPGGPGGGTNGTVERIDGSTVTLSAQDGSSVEVTTSDDTVVAIAETGSADDVDEGDQVLVMGTADGDTLAAERVLDRGDTATSDANGGPPGGMGGSATGEVSSVDGDTFTVTTGDGDVTVTMTDSTTIVVEAQGSVSDLSSGDTVMVQGETGDDGTVSATRIIAGDLPQGGPAMGGQTGGMPGGPPAQGGTTDGGSTGQVPAAPGGTTDSSGSTGSSGQPAGVTAGGATTT
jgi:cytochrome c-type biogenesis protein CcmE